MLPFLKILQTVAQLNLVPKFHGEWFNVLPHIAGMQYVLNKNELCGNINNIYVRWTALFSLFCGCVFFTNWHENAHFKCTFRQENCHDHNSIRKKNGPKDWCFQVHSMNSRLFQPCRYVGQTFRWRLKLTAIHLFIFKSLNDWWAFQIHILALGRGK